MPKQLTPEERKNTPAAQANSLQKPASLRPESLLDAYVNDRAPGHDAAQVIINQHWRPVMGWQSLIKYEASIDA